MSRPTDRSLAEQHNYKPDELLRPAGFSRLARKSYQVPGSYESIANEYYEARHITSRNFDAATLAFCQGKVFPIPSTGFVLELGAGRGSTIQYCRVDSSRVIQTDVSMAMLTNTPREPSLQRIQCDASDLPISSGVISAVTAFLYDPYNVPRVYEQIHQVLADSGVFLGTLPHHLWGTAVRRALGWASDTTMFITQTNHVRAFKSFLLQESQVDELLKKAGLKLLEVRDLYLPADTEHVSPHISLAASTLGLKAFELPIVKLVLARK